MDAKSINIEDDTEAAVTIMQKYIKTALKSKTRTRLRNISDVL